MDSLSHQLKKQFVTSWLLRVICSTCVVGQVAGQPKSESVSEELVQQQIDAWNRHHTDDFVAPYSDTTRLYTVPNTLTHRFGNKQELREFYARFFAKNPAVHCEVGNRIAVGNTVVLAEKVTGRSDGRVINSIVTYKIEGNKIARVYFDYRP